ncbi:hypothetical protein GCM10010393_31230 [Streptomyces gobitricini]|uniref:Uncharacterized protein n=1 Tax=Streptomyces gobitricini TaxID=68211 RepID=A0ABP5ZDB8_9ACTN
MANAPAAVPPFAGVASSAPSGLLFGFRAGARGLVSRFPGESGGNGRRAAAVRVPPRCRVAAVVPMTDAADVPASLCEAIGEDLERGLAARHYAMSGDRHARAAASCDRCSSVVPVGW